ncbi:uncharacterized protein LOC126661690 [Mercurialis annua]|uniref:uncharacterized protein LOC126661690 n=1 Tax=Mercurialis annua TaxID=3986 RepID=UPI002160059F|nr:uncharacterized protein LOC126661690 [Mercurialis annua]
MEKTITELHRMLQTAEKSIKDEIKDVLMELQEISGLSEEKQGQLLNQDKYHKAKGAFLNGNLLENVYMTQPEGFASLENSEKDYSSSSCKQELVLQKHRMRRRHMMRPLSRVEEMNHYQRQEKAVDEVGAEQPSGDAEFAQRTDGTTDRDIILAYMRLKPTEFDGSGDSLDFLEEFGRIPDPTRQQQARSGNTSAVQSTPVQFSAGRAGSSSRSSGSARTLPPVCQNCKRKHYGVCHLATRACFVCGRQGHFARECPMVGQQGYSTSVVQPFYHQPRPTYSTASRQGPVGSTFSGQRGRGFGGRGGGRNGGGRGTDQAPQAGRGQARVFALNPQEAQAANAVMQGTLPIYATDALIVFDPCATHSVLR